jgi:hypothetical protein
VSVLNVGLDFGTSSIKAVARPTMARNDRVQILRSGSGAARWRSMLGMVREGPERGRLLFFEECDSPEWQFHALREPNLKLSLLVRPESPVAAALESRWQCHYRALPTLLLAAALQQVLATVEQRSTARVIFVFMGAPVSLTHAAEQLEIFERALHAANLLCARWSGQRPVHAEKALREAQEAWDDAEKLPPVSERRTVVAPEALAACEGVASASHGTTLPGGRICIVDMGGGTTDIAWLSSDGGGGHAPLAIESVDIAGERLEAAIASEASRLSGRRVGRGEIWDARRSRPRTGMCLSGDGWALTLDQVRAVLRPNLEEFASRFRRAAQAVDPGYARLPATKFAFVGGATAWAPLESLLLEAIGGLHERAELLATGDLGVAEPLEGNPLAVALGLSNGPTGLRLEEWRPRSLVPQAETIERAPTLPTCSCGGLLELCVRCGGSGWLESEGGRRRFEASIDPFRAHAHSARCPYCNCDYFRGVIFSHIASAHPERLTAEPPVTIQQRPAPSDSISVERVRAAALCGDNRRLTDSEALLVSDLRWLRTACVRDGETRRAIAGRFLAQTVELARSRPWWHLPRAVAFAAREDLDDVRRECRDAETAGFAVAAQLTKIFQSNRPSMLIEAWECALT